MSSTNDAAQQTANVILGVYQVWESQVDICVLQENVPPEFSWREQTSQECVHRQCIFKLSETFILP